MILLVYLEGIYYVIYSGRFYKILILSGKMNKHMIKQYVKTN